MNREYDKTNIEKMEKDIAEIKDIVVGIFVLIALISALIILILKGII